ncbi:MAG: DUF882 domain-containing protein [Castellaniella sp.]|uniref:YcbK family protein n=1 Tax=Castellaniella sp. TaxID=1955812 RepID=UPI0011FCC586|nr:DUF882 domain-containing protein [Castellaniella sp.]TAN29899.1 MAG: DUF882 domain-containing protein [Castellaniella sp.]
MTKSFTSSRRQFLCYSAGVVTFGIGATYAPRVLASDTQASSLSFNHTHTKENISLIYSEGGHYVPQALNRLNHFLRDHYTGDVGAMDPELFDVLHRIVLVLGTALQPFQVISGYRCPATNNRLRAANTGGVAKHSLHMDGKAIDIRLPGVPLTELRDVALSLKAGGVGYYSREQFVHIDTGRVRHWGA